MLTMISKGLSDLTAFVDAAPDLFETAATMSLNQGMQRVGLPQTRREMLGQVNFPAGYLEQEDRLRIGRKARVGNIEASIVARDRATSLARFAGSGQTPANTRNNRGVQVQVKKGAGSTMLRKGFLVNLKNGNLGLAVRLQPGDELRNSEKAKKLADNVYLLYGPSVNQIALDVFDIVEPKIMTYWQSEFFRQFERLSRG